VVNFKLELGGQFNRNIQLDKRYREYRQNIESFEIRYPELLNILTERKERIAPIAANFLLMRENDTLQIGLNNLLRSYIHMTINRLITSNQRLHELMIYDFLYRQCQSVLARKKKSS
jgi:lantibiotic biosynthesis protein